MGLGAVRSGPPIFINGIVPLLTAPFRCLSGVAELRFDPFGINDYARPAMGLGAGGELIVQITGFIDDPFAIV